MLPCAPFAAAAELKERDGGFSFFEGDLAGLYQQDLELSSGRKAWSTRRFGPVAAVACKRLSPEDAVPAASGIRFSAGILFKS